MSAVPHTAVTLTSAGCSAHWPLHGNHACACLAAPTGSNRCEADKSGILVELELLSGWLEIVLDVQSPPTSSSNSQHAMAYQMAYQPNKKTKKPK